MLVCMSARFQYDVVLNKRISVSLRSEKKSLSQPTCGAHTHTPNNKQYNCVLKMTMMTMVMMMWHSVELWIGCCWWTIKYTATPDTAEPNQIWYTLLRKAQDYYGDAKANRHNTQRQINNNNRSSNKKNVNQRTRATEKISDASGDNKKKEERMKKSQAEFWSQCELNMTFVFVGFVCNLFIVCLV